MTSFSIPQIVDNIRQAKKELIVTQLFPEEAQELDAYIEHVKEPLLIMVMGEFSTGKSTFINALVGKKIAAVDVLPTTAVITKLCYGESERVMVYYRDGSSREYSPEEFNRLTAEADAASNAEHEKIDYVERAMPLPVLREMTVIDSPGLNALKKAHEEATRRFVAQADTVLWMISAEKAASDSEYQSIEKLSPRLKPIVIVNKMDTFDEEEEETDAETFLQNIRFKLKDKVQAVIGISAEYAFEGKTQQDAEKLEESNFSAFDNMVREVILPNRDAYKVNSLVDEINEWLYGIMQTVQAAETANRINEERDYNKYVENRAIFSRVEDAISFIAQPLKDYCQESANNASALTLLGILYDFGLVLSRDEEKAMEAYEKAAVKHNSCAQYILATHYEQRGEYDKAVYWLEKSEKAGNPLAASLMGEIERKKAEDRENERRAALAAKEAKVAKEEPEDTGKESNGADEKAKLYRMLAIAGVSLAVVFAGFAMFMLGKNDHSAAKEGTTAASVNQQVASTNHSSNSSGAKPSQTNSADKTTNNAAKPTQSAPPAPPAPALQSPPPQKNDSAPTGSHWIMDTRTGVYLWNPEPTDGESINWSGGYVTDGGYKWAEGTGVLTWYKDGKIIQVDNGKFIHGRHHGKFVHKFPSGNVMYSNWDHGRELE